jgi:hypothetical protein
MDKEKLKALIELHFKTDCLACIEHGKNPQECKSQSKCEVARSYFTIMDELKD